MEDSKRCRSLRQTIVQESKFSINNTLQLLLSTAQIEYEVKEMYKQVNLVFSFFFIV